MRTSSCRIEDDARNTVMSAANSNPKVLVIDDSRLARRMITNRVRAAMPGAEVFEADDGTTGFDAFVANEPDVVFLDLTMKIMDGFDALVKIREASANAKVYIVTADIQAGAKERCMQAGALDVVAKPIDDDTVAALLQRAL